MKTSATLLGLAALSLISGHAFADDAPAPESTGFSRASIVDRTPFAKSDKNDKKTSAGGPLELRGFYGSKDTLEVSLTRPDTKEAAWVRVGDKTAKWVVDEADPVAGTAEVRFDGLQLHLKLAQPDQPEAAGEPDKPQDEGAKRQTRGGRWGAMSDAGREAMHNAFRAQRDAARAAHPEWYDRNVTLTPEQQSAKDAYNKAGYVAARAAVAAVSPDDAAQMPAEPPFGGGPRGRQGGNAPAPAGASSSGTITISTGAITVGGQPAVTPATPPPAGQ